MLTRDVKLKVDGIDISGRLYLPGAKTSYPTVCLCHGIPSGRTPDPSDGGYPALAERVCREGFVTLIFNFRGAGESGGNLDMLGWTQDLKAAIDFLWDLPEVNKSHLYLCSFSGGAAVSVYVAAQDRRISGVAACACPSHFTLIEGNDPQSLVQRFRSIGVIRDDNFPPSVQKWFEGFRQVSPIQYVAGISPHPLLIIHGSKDEVVELSHAYQLYDTAVEPKRLVIIDGAGHRLRLEERAVLAVLDWLKSQIARQGKKSYN